MPNRCLDPQSFIGRPAGTGQCVDLVKIACELGATSTWREGERVRGNTTIRSGTAIATFSNGTYANQPTGNHAAIYLRQDNEGIVVVDQWSGQVAQERRIRFKRGIGSPSNDGDAFSIIR